MAVDCETVDWIHLAQDIVNWPEDSVKGDEFFYDLIDLKFLNKESDSLRSSVVRNYVWLLFFFFV
jgi:hypothetical protein